jgi:hypothetical protein
MMQDMIKAYLVGIAGAAGISTWKLIRKYWRILTLVFASVLAPTAISVITQEVPIVPPSSMHGPGAASVNISGYITETLVGDTARCSAGGASWSAQRVELKADTVTLLCIAP